MLSRDFGGRVLKLNYNKVHIEAVNNGVFLFCLFFFGGGVNVKIEFSTEAWTSEFIFQVIICVSGLSATFSMLINSNILHDAYK